MLNLFHTDWNLRKSVDLKGGKLIPYVHKCNKNLDQVSTKEAFSDGLGHDSEDADSNL